MKTSTSLRPAVLFDLDGTMVDSAPDIVAAANRMLDELGARPLPFSTVRDFIGKGMSNLVQRVLAVSNLAGTIDEADAESLFHQHYQNTNGYFGRVFPGVREGLMELQLAGYQLACVTNKPLALTEPLLESTGLAAFFAAVVAGDSLAQMKPDPEPLLHACRQLQADPATCVMVGDSGVDVAAARAAGMPVYIMRYGYPGPDGHEGMQCDGLIESFNELPALLTAAQAPTSSEREMTP